MFYFCFTPAEDDWYSKYEKSDQIAWLFMIRDPVQWLMAMYDNHHESGEMVKGRSFAQFLAASPWQSIVHNKGGTSGKILHAIQTSAVPQINLRPCRHVGRCCHTRMYTHTCARAHTRAHTLARTHSHTPVRARIHTRAHSHAHPHTHHSRMQS